MGDTFAAGAAVLKRVTCEMFGGLDRPRAIVEILKTEEHALGPTAELGLAAALCAGCNICPGVALFEVNYFKRQPA